MNFYYYFWPLNNDNLCTDVPPPAEKNREKRRRFFSRFFSEGVGTSVHRLNNDRWNLHTNPYNIVQLRFSLVSLGYLWWYPFWYTSRFSVTHYIRAICTGKNKTRLKWDANCTIYTSISYLRRKQLVNGSRLISVLDLFSCECCPYQQQSNTARVSKLRL